VRVALIGGGAVAVSVLDSLLLRAEEMSGPVELDVYEPARLGHGRAFAPDLDCALVNLPNGEMTVRGSQRDQFVRWLDVHRDRFELSDSAVAGAGFSPRRLFGSYLRDQFERCRAAAEGQGWRLTVRPEAAVDLAESTDGRLAVAGSSGAQDYTHVVVGIGGGEPADPYRLAGAPGFLADPYPLRETLADIPPEEHVIVVGTGLTAVDVVLALLARGHQGPVTLTSRRGVLPEIRAPRSTRDLTVLATAALHAELARRPELAAREVWGLLRAELTAAGVDVDAVLSWFGRPADAYLRHQLTDPTANVVQSIFMGIPLEVARTVRAALPAADVGELSRYKPWLKSIQCPMPPANARTLLSAMDTGQLRVVRGLSDVHHAGEGFRVTAAAHVPPARHLVDATRLPPGRTRGLARHLITALSRKFASWDRHGGLRTDLATARVRLTSGQHDPRLFAIGELTAGDIYFASSLPAVNRGADAAARSLATWSRPGPTGAARADARPRMSRR